MTPGMLDTSVVVDWHDPDVVGVLPDEMAISAITAAELTAGSALASTAQEAAKRQARLQEVGRALIGHVVAGGLGRGAFDEGVGRAGSRVAQASYGDANGPA